MQCVGSEKSRLCSVLALKRASCVVCFINEMLLQVKLCSVLALKEPVV